MDKFARLRNSLALSHGTKSDVLQQGMTTLHFQTKWNK